MMAWIAVLLLVAVTVAPGSAQSCEETTKFFEHNDLTKGPLDAGESSFCPKATCCRARDDNSLEKFAALTFADGMRMAVSGSLYELKRLSSRLSGSTCRALQKSSEESRRLLQQTYGPYFTRNSVLFEDFFCSISHAAIFPDCCNCEKDMDTITYDFLRKLVLVALKEQSYVVAVTKQYEDCALDKLTNKMLDDIFENRVNWLLTRLKTHVCMPCHIRQAVNAARDLVHSSVTTHASTVDCLKGLSCSLSCGCCESNMALTCSRRPCYSCCAGAVEQCVNSGGMAAAAPAFDWLMKEISRRAKILKEGKSDDVLDSLGINLSELIMEIYSKTDDTLTKLGLCGPIREHALTTGVLKPAVKCPLCSVNVSQQLRSVLAETELGAHSLHRTYTNLSYEICSKVSGNPLSDPGCNTCEDCSFSAGSSNPSVTHMLSTLVRALPRYFRPDRSLLPSDVRLPPFQCNVDDLLPGLPRSTPPATVPSTRSSVICDDEDVDCCDDEGSGSGSGDCYGSGGSGDGMEGSGSSGGHGVTGDRGSPDTETPVFTPPPKTVVITRAEEVESGTPTRNLAQSGSSKSSLPLSSLAMLLLAFLLVLLR